MAQEESNLTSLLPGAAALLLAVFGAVLLNQPELNVSRPKQPERLDYEFTGLQDVNARLWQDPFLAVDQYRADPKIKAKSGSPGTASVEMASGRCNKAKGDKERGESDATDGSAKEKNKLNIDNFSLGGRHDFEEMRKIFGCLGTHDRPSILAIMVPGGPYVGAEEDRRRMRYAVIQALNAGGFIPADNEHVGFFDVPDFLPRTRTAKGLPSGSTPSSDGNSSAKKMPTPENGAPTNAAGQAATDKGSATGSEQVTEPNRRFVPFEVYTRDSGDKGNETLLILWLDNDLFKQRPLDKFAALFRDLVFHCETSEAGDTPDTKSIKVIGPNTSGLLQRMIEESENFFRTGNGNSCEMRVLKKIRFFAATATASDESILMKGHVSIKGSEDLKWERTTLTDDKVTDAIVDELVLRYPVNGSDEEKKKGVSRSMILINEWDTLYGRSLPLEMLRSLGVDKRCNPDRTPRMLNTPDQPDDCPIQFSFLRGLDGALPGEETRSETAKEDKAEAAKKKARPTESSEGNAQYDYVRRLAWRIQGRDKLLRDIVDSNGVRFIGILGGDIYDKLSILRALRDSFPRAVFFTTDLDATMLQADQYRWTRNLIVGSSFGLELPRSLQRNIPPFRDSYQTSIYLTTLAVTSGGTSPHKIGIEARMLLSKTNRAAVFEIGRTRPFLLLPKSKDTIADPEVDSLKYGFAIEEPGSIWSLLLVGFVLLLLGSRAVRESVLGFIQLTLRRCVFTWRAGRSVLAGTATGLRRKLFLRTLFERTLFVAAVLSVFAGFAIAIRDSGLPGGEPLRYFEGVSIWPSEALRLLAAFLCLCFVMRAFANLRSNARAISLQYFPRTYRELRLPFPIDAKARYRARPWVRRFVAALQRRDSPTERAQDIWTRYLRGEATYRRLLRVAGLLFFYLSFCGLVIYGFGMPNIPARGNTAFVLHRIVLFSFVPLFSALLIVVVDATWKCVKLVEDLSHPDLEWSGDAIDSSKLSGPVRAHLSNWLALRVIEQRTAVIGKLIYAPFMVLVIAIVARSRLFDNWDMPVGLTLVFVTSFAFLFSCGLRLSRAAESARSRAIKYLTSAAIFKQGNGDQTKPMVKQFDRLIEEIRTLNEGAFKPFFQQPAFKALLLPFGSAGGISLIEYFMFSMM